MNCRSWRNCAWAKTSRRPLQPRLQPDIEAVDDALDPPGPGAQTVENAGFAFAAVSDEGAHMLLGLNDRRAVGRPVNRVAPAQQFVERGEIGGHIAVGGRNHAGRPPHDMVAAEQNAAGGQSKAQMIRGMARRVHRFEQPILAGDLVAVPDGDVGNKIG